MQRCSETNRASSTSVSTLFFCGELSSLTHLCDYVNLAMVRNTRSTCPSTTHPHRRWNRLVSRFAPSSSVGQVWFRLRGQTKKYLVRLWRRLVIISFTFNDFIFSIPGESQHFGRLPLQAVVRDCQRKCVLAFIVSSDVASIRDNAQSCKLRWIVRHHWPFDDEELREIFEMFYAYILSERFLATTKRSFLSKGVSQQRWRCASSQIKYYWLVVELLDSCLRFHCLQHNMISKFFLRLR